MKGIPLLQSYKRLTEKLKTNYSEIKQYESCNRNFSECLENKAVMRMLYMLIVITIMSNIVTETRGHEQSNDLH